MAKEKKKLPSPAKRSPEDAMKEMAFLDGVIDNFKGELDDLEQALGMYLLGRQVGWRVLVIIHTKRTIRKHEEILGIKFREELDEVGPLATRSVGYNIVVKLSNFWKAVSGAVKVDQRREIAESLPEVG